MVRERKRLPGSRGNYQGQDAFVAQNESQFSRARLEQTTTREVFQLMEFFPWGDVRLSSAVGATQLRLTPLFPVRDSYRVRYARAYVSGASASNYFWTALYTFENNQFQKVAGSQFKTPTDNTRRITTDLGQDLILSPGNYWVAYWGSSGVPTYNCLDTGVNTMVDGWTLTMAAMPDSGLPPRIDIAGFSRNADGQITPDAAYLSDRAVLYL